MPKFKAKIGMLIVTGVLIAGGIIYLATIRSKSPAPLDNFAKCLKEKGAIFYGTFWCPHCQNQKAMFGRSAKYLSYVECSTADGRSQKQECADQQIKGYPTWKFSDDSREEGEVSLTTLAQKTGCEFPENL